MRVTLISVLLLMTNSAVSAQSGILGRTDLMPDSFVPSYYHKLYPDLANAFGANPEALANHYRSCGIAEGRSPNPYFDPHYYLTRYPDLAAAYGATNYRGALEHWLACGIGEGRRGSPFFDPMFYFATYGDLAAVYGANNYRMAYFHYSLHGVGERRRGIPESESPIFNASGLLVNSEVVEVALRLPSASQVKQIGTMLGKGVDWVSRGVTVKAVAEGLYGAYREQVEKKERERHDRDMRDFRDRDRQNAGGERHERMERAGRKDA